MGVGGPSRSFSRSKSSLPHRRRPLRSGRSDRSKQTARSHATHRSVRSGRVGPVTVRGALGCIGWDWLGAGWIGGVVGGGEVGIWEDREDVGRFLPRFRGQLERQRQIGRRGRARALERTSGRPGWRGRVCTGTVLRGRREDP